MDWVLLTAAGIILIGFAIGLYRGAVKIAISLLTTMVTLVLVTFATPYVSGLITSMTPIGDMIQEQVTAAVVTAATSRAAEGEEGLTEESVRQVLDAAGVSEETLGSFGISIEDIVNERVTGDQLAEYGISSNILDGLKAQGVTEEIVESAEIPRDMQVAAIESADLPEVFKDLLSTNNNSEIYAELGAETFGQYIGAFLSELIIHIVSFLCTFILVVLILRAIIFALNIVAEFPVLGIANRLIGGGIGIACALMVLWVLCVIVTLLYVTPPGKEIYEAIQANGFLKMIYDYNPVMGLAIKL